MQNVQRSDPFRRLLDSPLTAIRYETGAEIENLLAGVADDMKTCGYRLAGFVLRGSASESRSNRDMVLEDLATGRLFNIAEDRGPGARGCKLDVSALLTAGELAAAAIESGADMLILNKFGKTEHEGGGLRPLIGRAIDLGVPVLIAVPQRNWASWEDFSDGLSNVVSISEIRCASVVLGGRIECDSAGTDNNETLRT